MKEVATSYELSGWVLGHKTHGSFVENSVNPDASKDGLFAMICIAVELSSSHGTRLNLCQRPESENDCRAAARLSLHNMFQGCLTFPARQLPAISTPSMRSHCCSTAQAFVGKVMHVRIVSTMVIVVPSYVHSKKSQARDFFGIMTTTAAPEVI